MTRQEIKDELKQTEGDPQIKGRLRERQRAIARQRMMADVPKADVVITNPTHYAVAIKFDESKAAAPIVVAKGMGYVAARIKEIARKYGVPLVEDRPLAQTLYKTVEVGRVIPPDLYQAVAVILAAVYRQKNRSVS
jgi:flagellar biosynthetic protein FlhB